jgi:hypothetical protein
VITFLTTERHRYTLTKYLEAVPEQARDFTSISYRELLVAGRQVGPGAVIFADIERLPAKAIERVAHLWQALRADPRRPMLNHPTRSMKRYELLRDRYVKGLNAFNVYRLGSGEQPQRWPVFVRNENEHDGPLSGLLRDVKELQEYERTRSAAEPDLPKLVVEFCDTRDDQGVNRKYSAFRVGAAIVPRHVFFSNRRWVIKEQDLITPELLAEEQRYLESNPHQAQLRTIFDAARIEYGRIDYSFKDGNIQVWEINTNPMLLRRSQLSEERAEVHRSFCRAIQRAFAEFEAATTNGG